MTRRDVFRIFGGASALPAVKSVETLQVEKDDCIVIKLNGHPGWAAIENIRESVKNGLKGRFKDTPVMIIDGSIDIQVLKKK